MTTPLTPTLHSHFATELPELSVPRKAKEVSRPSLALLNDELALELGMSPDFLRSPSGLGLLTGNDLPASSSPVAQAYAGHQFGGYSPRLGDGRALLLGEVELPDGTLRDLHLKGSGRTPFSRGGDGLAALGPMLREYVVSEAMHALRIPTTRSLAVVATNTSVERERPLPGALLVRVASSHLRVGSLQYASATGDHDLLRRLADHAIRRHYPHVQEAEQPYLALLDSVVSAQASLVAQWMLVGFIHGVMNTDNMTISGETIDYGPCAFMDLFDPATVYSSIDLQGRYAYGRQPMIAAWNLARLAEALLPLLAPQEEEAVKLATASLEQFAPQHLDAWLHGMKAKIGLPSLEDERALSLVDDLLTLLRENRVDYTSFFRRLSLAASGEVDAARNLVLDLASFDSWAEQWRSLDPDPSVMDSVNPIYIPRNHLVEEALAAASLGDLAPVSRLLEALSSPYSERPGLERYAQPAPGSFGESYQTFCGT